jgi:hypothetical protein
MVLQDRNIPYPEPFLASRREDPYIRQSEKRADPYRRTERQEDPYRMTERRDDPYRSTERPEDPYRMTERREDPYRSTERREDPYTREIRNGRSERRDDYNRPPSPTPARNYEAYVFILL